MSKHRLLSFSIALLFHLNVSGQVLIDSVEYFINNDPGIGNGTIISTSPVTGLDLQFDTDNISLPTGYHRLYIRARNENGVWSFLESRSFYVLDPVSVANPTPPDITELEYFVDNDPGVGLGSKIDVIDGINVDINSTVTETTDNIAYPSGYHTVGFRSRTANGNWGWTEYRNFYITTTGSVTPPTIKQVVAAEYYFDNDPGQGLGTPVGSFASGFSIDLNELVSQSDPQLTPGYHTFNVRSKDEDGKWGFVERRPVYVTGSSSVTAVTDIAKVEYFFDGVDPGPGNAVDLPITPGQQEIEFNTIDIPTSAALIDGEHTISFRAKNGNGWGIIEIDTFDVLDDCMQPIASFDTQLACAGTAVTFNNTSTDLQGDATYRWYLDGDAIIDETTQNTSFTYPFPGTYVVALAVRQGTICLDSISSTIEIQPQPVAVFSTSGTSVNQPTNFLAAASNLPAGAIWEWEFDDGDAMIDDNTAGTTSFTYTSTATFNPVLTITDNNGCFVSVTNAVTITSGGGGSNPTVNFLADNGCVGANINFVDISQNLPHGSTYSWDFNGDGTEDATTVGSTNFTYSQAGTYNASLTIDVGGSTILSAHTVEIVDVPIIDFSAQPVCEETSMNFVDLSNTGYGNNQYEWDFNNDNSPDYNDSINVNHLYLNPSTYIVSLKINNGYGCEQEISKQVHVISRPNVNFDWNIDCADTPIIFNDLSLNKLDTASYTWNFGDGSSIIQSKTRSTQFNFSTAGLYDVSLTVSNIDGCEATLVKPIEIFDIPEPAIEINARCYGQESQIIDLSQKVTTDAKYLWDFGVNQPMVETSSGDTSFTYNQYNSYLVTLTVENSENCRASTEALVEFADAATPNFATNKLCEGEEVIFTNLSTDVNPAAIYSWDFDGDGNEDSAFPGSTAHIFESDGTYNAQLTIDNGGNCLAYKTIPLVVTPPPLVDLGPDEILCEAGTVVLDAGTGYNAYLWPDGSTEQTYSIDQIGEYMVRVQDALQCYNTDTIAVKLLGDPVVAFDYSFDLTYLGIKILFENLSSNADSYEWEYAGAVFSEEEHASMIVTDWDIFDVAVYEICMTAFNDCNQVSICENVYVSPTRFMELSGSLMSAYPSPSTGLVQVDLSVESQVDQVLLINNSGEVIWYSDVSSNNFEIDLSGYDRGAYYIIGRQPGKLIYQKIIKL